MTNNRLAGFIEVWIDPVEYLEFFLRRRGTIIISTSHIPGGLKANLTPSDHSKFTNLLKGVLKDAEEQSERPAQSRSDQDSRKTQTGPKETKGSRG